MVDVDKVRQIAYDIHLYFGSGFLEKVYENSLVNRLKKSGFEVEQQSSLCAKK
ncbi:MAG: GxxExxY protein [Treponema sp.]|nr:GxxExxY protein [Treponema sp.]